MLGILGMSSLLAISSVLVILPVYWVFRVLWLFSAYCVLRVLVTFGFLGTFCALLYAVYFYKITVLPRHVARLLLVCRIEISMNF